MRHIVVWRVEVNADTPMQAATEARKQATEGVDVFEVFDPRGDCSVVNTRTKVTIPYKLEA